MRETGKRAGVPSFIIDCADKLDFLWLDGKINIGISSGASVPNYIVNELTQKIQIQFPGTTVERMGKSDEQQIFPLPEI